MRTSLRFVVPLVTLSAAPGCATEIAGGGGEDVALEAVPLTLERDLDLLFVVDDSGSMRQEQEALAAAFGRFAATLQGPGEELPDLHIGVVSTNMGTGDGGGGGEACAGSGDDGILQLAESCTVPTDGTRFISDVAGLSGAREINHAGDLAAQFGCMTQLGVAGCGFEQPFESMKRALMNQDENAGFLRPEADLAVIFVTDEDDCSASDMGLFDPSQDSIDDPLGELSSFRCFEFGVECAPVEGGERAPGARDGCVPEVDSPYVQSVDTYVQFLQDLKPDASDLFVATISADDSPIRVGLDPFKEPTELWVEPTCVICPGGTQEGCMTPDTGPLTALVAATPAVRMNTLVEAFGDGGAREDICTYDPATDGIDFKAALGGVADRLAPRIDTECVVADLLDVDAAADGLQWTCELVETIDGGETTMQACGGDVIDAPCFRLEENAGQCTATASHLELVVERGGAAVPAGATRTLRCAL